MRTIATLFFGLLFQVLCGQSVDDPEFMLPPSPGPGQVDISLSFRTKGIRKVTLFDPKGIRRANMVLLLVRGSFEEDADDKDGGIDVYQIEFDRGGAPLSSEQLTARAYDVGNDAFFGFHSIDIRHEYAGDDKVNIHYLDSKEGVRYVWKYENERMVKCQLFSGFNFGLTAYWEWEYQSDTLVSDFRKFDYLERLQYHYKYAYDEDGQLNHVFKIFTGKDARVSIYQFDRTAKVVRHYKSLDDAYDDCYTVANGLLVKDEKCKPRRKSRATSEIWRYNSAGLPLRVEQLSRSGNSYGVLEYAYNEAGSILRETYIDKMADPLIIQYTYNANNQVTRMDYVRKESNGLIERAEFDYDEKGNVRRWNLSGINLDRLWRSETITFEMEYHYFE